MKKQSPRLVINGSVNITNLRGLQLFFDYLLSKNRSNQTIYSYKSDLLQFLKWIGEKDYNIITTEDIESFILFCQKNGNNEDRIKRRCSSISSFYIFLRKKSMTNNNPMEFFERPRKKLNVQKKIFLTQEQVAELKIKLKTLKNPLIESYILISLSTAARKNAIRNLKWDDIDFEERTIRALEKGPKEVILTFSDEVKENLLNLKEYYIKNNMLREYVFTLYYQGNLKQIGEGTFNDYAKVAGELIQVSGLTPHSLRRTTANILKENGVPLEVISIILNHNDTKVTQKYIKYNFGDIQNLKDSLGI